MPFFTVTADSTRTSPQFWLYWAITIPITLAVLGVWITWLQFTATKRKKEDEEELGSKRKGD